MQAGLNIRCSQTNKRRFSPDVVHMRILQHWLLLLIITDRSIEVVLTHPRSLASAIVIRSLESEIVAIDTCKTSILYLVSVSEQLGLILTLSQTLKTWPRGEHEKSFITSG